MYQAVQKCSRSRTSCIEISKMRVEGVWVPAFKFAVETSTESGAQFYAD